VILFPAVEQSAQRDTIVVAIALQVVAVPCV